MPPDSAAFYLRIPAHAYNDKNECLYEHPGDDPPAKKQGSKLACTAGEVPPTLDRGVFGAASG